MIKVSAVNPSIEEGYAIINTNGTVIQSGVFQDNTEEKFDLPDGIYSFSRWSILATKSDLYT
jgi:hypothetical protein